ncbi:MAG: Gfo/Idh/MocA family oxidoreductase [Chloroflexi bacterium]|nr:Gfo/Idh/MocA family oxidoreductase [Chloroflexota bacterium]
MKTYRAAVIGCSRMGGFIDNEVIGTPKIVLPYSHAAGFAACTQTDLVACADTRVDVMEEFGKLYNIPKASQYTDYREMIAKEQLDIVSVATQPEQRADIVIYAVEQGVKAIYAEKAMSASLAEAYAMVEALERHKVAFNLGTNRRWSPEYDRMKEVIDSGELGALKSIICYNTGTLFNMGSHYLDLALRLNSDQPVEWVQANLRANEDVFDGDLLRADPVGEGIVHFANGVTAYMLVTPRSSDYEVICENGALTAYVDGLEWQLRQRVPVDPHGHTGFMGRPFTEPEPASATLRLIEDLVQALDRGEPATRCGPRVALASTELIFAFIESHRRGGARVTLPLQARNLRLQRNATPHKPKFQA